MMPRGWVLCRAKLVRFRMRVVGEALSYSVVASERGLVTIASFYCDNVMSTRSKEMAAGAYDDWMMV